MAAIDKIYVNSYEEYLQFKNWCKKQPMLSDKYNVRVSLMNYVFRWSKNDWKHSRPIFQAPYYVDAYLIRNCPFDFIQEELMLNYGYWSQKRIKSFYEDVKNWQDGECPYWAKLDDFITLDDGTMTIKGLEKSDYERIKDGEIYTSPKRSNYVYGKHFRCTKHPRYKYNTPFNCNKWFIDVNIPGDNLWYHENHNSWDFYDEFVISDWTSSTAFCKTIKALKRLIRKWKLPIGTIVRATGRYTFDTYEFIITK